MNSASDIKSLEDYLEKNPDSLMFARVADVYLDKQDVDKAITICEAGIKKHPYYITGHFVLGKCYLAKGLFEQAEKEFKRVLLFDSRYVTAHKYYGDVMKEIGWENTCAMSYKKIVQIDPLDDIARDMAKEYLEQEDVEDDVQAATIAEEPAEAIAPMPVTPEEEELMFEKDPLSEAVQKVEPEKPAQPEEQVSEAESGETSATEKAPQDEELDERKAEEFSTILDDIFKDEAASREDATSKSEKPKPEQPEEEEPLPETVLTDLGFKDSDEDPFPFNDEPAKDAASVDASETRLEKPFEFAEHASSVPDSRGSFSKKSRGKIVTPTLGEIYAAQGQYSKAIDVFETLLKKQPDNKFYSNKIEELKKKLAESKDASKG